MNSTEENEEYPVYDLFNYDIQTKATTADSPTCSDATCIFMTTVLVIIFILGSAGNAVVIWIAGFKLKKSVNTTWYLSLAVSDFLFCFSLPFTVVYTVREDWIFGPFMCKLISFIMFLNMFSSIFLLVIISVDRCVAVIFPVWAQNHRTIRKASVIVTLVWIISAGISTPSLIIRAVQPKHGMQTQVCFNDYKNDQDHISIVVCRCVFGFVIPLLIIFACYVVIIGKLKINQSAKSKKPFKIMTALIITFFICWIPFHIFALMELNQEKYESILHVGQVIGVTLASANSCLNPFLYAFMGKDFKRKCSALLSKIENAIDEDGRSTMRGTSITTSGDRRFSTAV
ncbi:chemerin-like receptor 1 [Astyanax mexicanus]|uniref:chemerin-like receptor 1 n=1 Tax=Astyanax mexicanus TaxID=7994 RepID=UPI0020CAAA92|nr:chemerin-like receptor 1 [Astyanax mexicanus]